MIEFGRAICGDYAAASAREWLSTNGIGGYAAGTISGALTRCYHGLLVAALDPPLGRTLMLVKLDAVADYGGRRYELATDCRAGGAVAPAGHLLLESFRLEGTTPVWTYALADALLELRVWMRPGHNTTYARYTLLRGSEPVGLELTALADHRDHHGNTRAGQMTWRAEAVDSGLKLVASEGAAPLYLTGDRAAAAPALGWHRGYVLAIEHERGLKAVEDHARVARLAATVAPGESLLVAASAESGAPLDAAAMWAERSAYEGELLARLDWSDDPAVHRLALAADQFVVRRTLAPSTHGHSVLAGYHWFSDWGRDTMIALPGLTLPTGRPEVAASVLRTFARFVDRGMLPNRFPDEGEEPEYNTADATLWYFEAIRAYHASTGDDELVRELFPALREIVAWHERGTRYGIGVDPADGLLRCGEQDSQLTWMDVRVDGWVVTPRHGKPVEINALWHNALRVMADLARLLGEPAEAYEQAAGRVAASFGRFWSDELGHCYDVLDTPRGDDPTLRPNQVIAAALHHSPLAPEGRRAVVDVCARRLLTSHGLRSLDPAHPDYQGRYRGDVLARDGAYHQGTVWGWLIGPFVSAHYAAYGDRAAALALLAPLLRHLRDTGLGTISEIFDGDPPHAPRGCVAQAWSVAEVLRCLHALRAA
jgi:predicted glycogen debranching enzyme